MKIRNRNLVLVLGGLAALALTASAHADTETFNATIGQDFTDFTAILALHQFNPALGTLESVQLDYTVNTTVSDSVTNNSSHTANFSFTDNVTASLLNINANASVSHSFSGVAHNTTQNFGPATASGSGGATYSAPADFAPFIGTGNTSITVTTTALETSTGGGGNVHDDLSTQASGMATVTYTYDPIPEASTLLGFTALLGMGVIRLRRRSTKA